MNPEPIRKLLLFYWLECGCNSPSLSRLYYILKSLPHKGCIRCCFDFPNSLHLEARHCYRKKQTSLQHLETKVEFLAYKRWIVTLQLRQHFLRFEPVYELEQEQHSLL